MLFTLLKQHNCCACSFILQVDALFADKLKQIKKTRNVLSLVITAAIYFPYLARHFKGLGYIHVPHTKISRPHSSGGDR